MTKNTFKNYICKPHCIFFKDGEKEEMACHGAVIAQRFVKNQKIPPQYLDKELKKKEIRFEQDDDIIHMVCAKCSFETQDCDYRSSSPPKNATPCGGYIFLYLLKSKGIITGNDLREVCVEQT